MGRLRTRSKFAQAILSSQTVIGVVIVPQEIVEPVLLAAERLEEIENDIRRHGGLDRGEEVDKRYPKFDHVQKPAQG